MSHITSIIDADKAIAYKPPDEDGLWTDKPEPDEKYSRPLSLPWCMFSAVQLVLRIGLAATAALYALLRGGDAGLVEFEATLRETNQSLVSDGEDPVSTEGLFWRTVALLVWIGVPVGAIYFIGDKLGAWVWGA